MQDRKPRIRHWGAEHRAPLNSGIPKNSGICYTASPIGQLCNLRGRLRGFLCISLIIILALMSVNPQKGGADPSPEALATLTKVEGEVLVRLSGETLWRPIGSGFPLREGDMVRTGKGSSAEIRFYFPEGGVEIGRLCLVPESELVIDSMLLASPPPGEGSTGLSGLAFKIKLIIGRIYVKVFKQLVPHLRFDVETDAASIGVRGTFFAVSMSPSGITGVSVQEGLVEVSAQEKSVLLGAGQMTFIYRGMPPKEPGPMSDEERKGWHGLGRWMEGVGEAAGNLAEKGKEGQGAQNSVKEGVKEKLGDVKDDLDETEDKLDESTDKLGDLEDSLIHKPPSGLLGHPSGNGNGP